MRQSTGAGTNYLVETPGGVLYSIYMDQGSDVAFKKSSDGGLSWSDSVVVSSNIGAQAVSVWYDRWSGINGDLIHCAYNDTTADDVFYRSINTASSDALSSETVIFAGASSVIGSGYLTICRARGGNLYCIYDIDGGTERGFARSTDVGANWGARADPTEAGTDLAILMPGWAADNQDMMAFYWDVSANEISRKLYDDSANSWGETSIAGSMTSLAQSTGYPNFAGTVDSTNSRNLLVAWSAADTSNADLRCWHVTESAITEVTNVVLNSTDDQGLCAIGIDTNTEDWYVFYGGKSDGSETFPTAMNIYYKVSTDDGATWGSETKLTNYTRNIDWLTTVPRFTTEFYAAYMEIAASNGPYAYINALVPSGGGATGGAHILGGTVCR